MQSSSEPKHTCQTAAYSSRRSHFSSIWLWLRPYTSAPHVHAICKELLVLQTLLQTLDYSSKTQQSHHLAKWPTCEKTARFSWVKASKVNTETGSPVTCGTTWFIWQSFPPSSLDLQFTSSIFFLVLQDIQYRQLLRPPGIQRGKVSMWPQRRRLAGQSRYWLNCFRLSGYSLHMSTPSISITFSLYSTVTQKTTFHCPRPEPVQTWTPPSHELSHTHTRTYSTCKIKFIYTHFVGKVQWRKIYCDSCCSRGIQACTRFSSWTCGQKALDSDPHEKE